MNLSDPNVMNLGTRPRAARPALRLVETPQPTRRVDARHVAAANRAAAGLSADDARWVLAAKVAQEIRRVSDGRTALVTPDARRRLTASARAMGLRAFDANLIIAIVQDALRRGEELGEDVEGRLQMIRGVERGSTAKIARWPIAASAALAAGIFAALAAWLGGA